MRAQAPAEQTVAAWFRGWVCWPALTGPCLPGRSPRNRMEVPLSRSRFAVLALVLAGLLAPSAARAAAEVHRLNLALSAVPTSINAEDFNQGLDWYSRTLLTPAPRGFEPLEKVRFTILFDAELRYFITRNLSLNAGVGHLRAKSAKEYLPALVTAINIRADLITVPVHLGASYYLQPYNQGDFQARVFWGGGMVQYTHSRTEFLQALSGTDSTTTAQLGGSFKRSATQDGTGYYAEGGVHMFFASRYSIMLSGMYRSGVLTDFIDEQTRQVVLNPVTGKPFTLDVSGVGLRMSAGIGF